MSPGGMKICHALDKQEKPLKMKVNQVYGNNVKGLLPEHNKALGKSKRDSRRKQCDEYEQIQPWQTLNKIFSKDIEASINKYKNKYRREYKKKRRRRTFLNH